MKKKFIKIFLFLTLIGTLYTGVSIFWVKSGREGIISWPANTLFTLFPPSRRVFKHYYAGDESPKYLRSNPYSRLVVEVDYLDGYKPQQSDLDWFVEFMQKYLDKPEGLEVVFSDRIADSKEKYSLEDVRRLERKYRSFRDKDTTTTLYLLFLNTSERELVKGTAFNSSAIVIFVERLRRERKSNYPFVNSIFLQNVLRHEFGHLLGLVNLGFVKSEHPERELGRRYFGVHEAYIFGPLPNDYASHSKNADTVMSIFAPFYIERELESSLSPETLKRLEENNLDGNSRGEVINAMSSLGYPLEFDDYDIQDLDAIRGYRLE